jgi:cytochrome c-type biogenesis protein CcmH
MTKPRLLLATLLLGALAALPLFTVPAGAQQTDRAKQIGGKFLCMCGCGQILTQCNHVGCQVSASMLKELDQWVARGDSEDKITQAFVQEYGTMVYAEPPKSGISLVAWAMPTVYLVLGTVLVIFVIAKWRKRPVTETSATHSGPQVSKEALERARAQASRETED